MEMYYQSPKYPYRNITLIGVSKFAQIQAGRFFEKVRNKVLISNQQAFGCAGSDMSVHLNCGYKLSHF